MVDESEEHEDLFPPPNGGIPIICALKLFDEDSVPLLYFGRETHASGREVPLSPEIAPPKPSLSASRQGSNNPLNSIIRKWEAKFARHGGFMESGDFVSSNGKNDGRYYEADEWLDDGDVDENGDDDEFYDVDLAHFRTIDTSNDLTTISGLEGGDAASEDEVEEEYETDEEGGENDAMDSTGGSWEVLIKRLEPNKQPVVREVVTELQQVQAFPGHSKQKKQKSLRDLTARLRRLLPKVNQIQSQWQAAIWQMVNTANDLVTMQSFIDLWNEVAATKQREDITKEREPHISKLAEPVTELHNAWKNGESILRSRNESCFNLITKLWELWNQEEECSGRGVAGENPIIIGKSFNRTEKRFATHLIQLLPNVTDLPTDFSCILLRLALFGSKKSAAAAAAAATTGPSESDNGAADQSISTTTNECIPLPAIVHIYRKNELLKCKLLEIRSLTSQAIQVIDKEWESGRPSGPTGDVTIPEFNSFSELFESYQQKFVRKQDRIRLPSQYDGWKLFSFKNQNSGEYIALYDVINKASNVGHFGFTDKSGNPIFLPPIAPVRTAEADKKKKIQDAKDERKRKRDAAIAKMKIEQANDPPLGEEFVPFPEFSREVFKVLVAAPTAPVAPPTGMVVD